MTNTTPTEPNTTPNDSELLATPETPEEPEPNMIQRIINSVTSWVSNLVQ